MCEEKESGKSGTMRPELEAGFIGYAQTGAVAWVRAWDGAADWRRGVGAEPLEVLDQSRIFSTSASLTEKSSQLRTADSRRTRME